MGSKKAAAVSDRVVFFLFLVLICGLRSPLVEAYEPIQVTQRRKATTAAARLASWHRHVRLADASPFRDLTWRCIGPRMSGGRIE